MDHGARDRAAQAGAADRPHPEDVLADPDLYTRDPQRFADLTEMAAKLRSDRHIAEERWLQVAEMAEQLAAN